MGVLSPDQVRQLNAQFMSDCRKEVLRSGSLSRGFRVRREALLQCFKRKWLEYKKQVIAQMA